MAIWDFSVIYMSIYVPSRNVCQPFLSASQRLSVSLRPTLTAPLLRIATPAQPPRRMVVRRKGSFSGAVERGDGCQVAYTTWCAAQRSRFSAVERIGIDRVACVA